MPFKLRDELIVVRVPFGIIIGGLDKESSKRSDCLHVDYRKKPDCVYYPWPHEQQCDSYGTVDRPKCARRVCGIRFDIQDSDQKHSREREPKRIYLSFSFAGKKKSKEKEKKTTSNVPLDMPGTAAGRRHCPPLLAADGLGCPKYKSSRRRIEVEEGGKWK